MSKLLNLFTGFKATIIKVVAFFIGILSIFGFGYLKGKQRQKEKQIKKENADLEQVVNAYKKAKVQQEKIKQNDDKIKRNAKIKIKETKSTNKYDLGKWVVVFIAIMPFITGCGKPEIRYIQTPCVKPYKLERPHLNNVIIYPGLTLDNNTYGKIIENDILLKSQIKRYEKMIDVINEGKNEQNKTDVN